MEDQKLKILIVEPMQKPYVREISGSLESMQQIVSGANEAVYPFDDPARRSAMTRVNCWV